MIGIIGIAHHLNEVMEEVKMDYWTGTRARIGVIVPNTSQNIEPEFYAMCPEGVSVHTTRINISRCNVKGLTEMGESEELERCIQLLTPAQVDSIVYAGTSVSFLKGPGCDQALIKRMEEVSDGIPCTTTTTAVVVALQELGIKKISVATPYVEEVNDRLYNYFTQVGFEILKMKGLQMDGPNAINQLVPETVYRLAKQADVTEAEGIFISCTGLRTGAVVEDLERDLKKPVVAANQASFWHALKLARIGGYIDDFGILLRKL